MTPVNNYAMTYAEQMKDVRWLSKRLEVIKRDGNICQECHKQAKDVSFITVHHNFYFNRRYKYAWDYPLKMLTTLCWECHKHRSDAVDLIHMALLNATTGDLIMWARRIKNERPNLQRKLTKQANKVNLSPPNPAPIQFPTDGKTVWDRMREAANAVIELQGVRNA